MSAPAVLARDAGSIADDIARTIRLLDVVNEALYQAHDERGDAARAARLAYQEINSAITRLTELRHELRGVGWPSPERVA